MGKSLGEVLRELRGDTTQLEMAKKFDISSAYYSMIENGKNDPSSNLLLRIYRSASEINPSVAHRLRAARFEDLRDGKRQPHAILIGGRSGPKHLPKWILDKTCPFTYELVDEGKPSRPIKKKPDVVVVLMRHIGGGLRERADIIQRTYKCPIIKTKSGWADVSTQAESLGIEWLSSVEGPKKKGRPKSTPVFIDPKMMITSDKAHKKNGTAAKPRPSKPKIKFKNTEEASEALTESLKYLTNEAKVIDELKEEVKKATKEADEWRELSETLAEEKDALMKELQGIKDKVSGLLSSDNAPA